MPDSVVVCVLSTSFDKALNFLLMASVDMRIEGSSLIF